MGRMKERYTQIEEHAVQAILSGAKTSPDVYVYVRDRMEVSRQEIDTIMTFLFLSSPEQVSSPLH